MARWICPFWLFSSVRATDGLTHQIQLTDLVVTNPTTEEAGIELVFYEARNGGTFERSPVFGGRYRIRAQSQLAYRTDIRAYSGSRYGWFELFSDVNVVPHAALTRVKRQATDAGLVEDRSETTLHLERFPEAPTMDEPIIPTIPMDPGGAVVRPGIPGPLPPPFAALLEDAGHRLIRIARRLTGTGRVETRAFHDAELFVLTEQSERILRRDLSGLFDENEK